MQGRAYRCRPLQTANSTLNLGQADDGDVCVLISIDGVPVTMYVLVCSLFSEGAEVRARIDVLTTWNDVVWFV